MVGASAADAGHILVPYKRIGPGWHVDNPAWMSFVAFSRDGRRVAADAAATGDDVSGDLTIWTFPGGKFVRRVPGRPYALSPDWQFGATSTGLIRLGSGRPNPAADRLGFSVAAFRPDGRAVAVAAAQDRHAHPSIRLIDLADGRAFVGFGHANVTALAFSPDGKRLAAGYWNAVALWDPATGRRSAMLRGIGRYVDGLAFSPDGRRLAVGTDLGVLEIWDVRHAVRLRRIELGGGEVSTPAFGPDGSLVAVGVYGTGSVWLVDARSGRLVDRRRISDIGCGSVAFSPDGRFLIAPSTGGLVTWPYDVGGTIRVFRVVHR